MRCLSSKMVSGCVLYTLPFTKLNKKKYGPIISGLRASHCNTKLTEVLSEYYYLKFHAIVYVPIWPKGIFDRAHSVQISLKPSGIYVPIFTTGKDQDEKKQAVLALRFRTKSLHKNSRWIPWNNRIILGKHNQFNDNYGNEINFIVHTVQGD